MGLPYPGRACRRVQGLLGNERLELRRSDYDLMGAVNNFRTLGYPGVEDFEEALLNRPTPRGWPTPSSVGPDIVHAGTRLLIREEVSRDEARQETKIGCATMSC